jgi:hypothetical protein
VKKPKLLIAAAALLIAAATVAGTRPMAGNAGGVDSATLAVLKKGS